MDDASLEFAEQTIDPAIARAERRLRLLEEVTEIGMELIRALRPGVEAAPEVSADEVAAAPRREPADLYASLSRAIRLTIALETRTDRFIADLKAGPKPVGERQPKAAAKRRQDEADDDEVTDPILVWAKMTQIIEAEAESPEHNTELRAALNEFLDRDEADRNITMRPLGETIERLCRDFGLQPDWSLWADEPWMKEWQPPATDDPAVNVPSRPDDPRATTPAEQPPNGSDVGHHDLE